MNKSPSGIHGFDAILRGGFPEGRTTIVLGGPGTGKTVLAMQFLVNGAADFGEPGLMISFEESPAALKLNFSGMSAASAMVLDTSVHLIDGRPADDTIDAGESDLSGLIAIAAALVERHGIRRVAVDGIDALFARVNDAGHRRHELSRMLNWLAASRLTTILTIKDLEGEVGLPGYFGSAEYAADGAIHLRTKSVGELSRRTFSVIKMRGSGFDAGAHPYIITDRGIRALHSPLKTQTSTADLDEQLSSGVERLDRMLVGGYRAGTTTLISGLPGTSKTTLGASFLEAGALAGERCLFVGFDEPAAQMVRDVKSVGIDLAPHLASGILRLESFAAGAAIADEHFLSIERLIDEHRPKRMVIDPISALERAGGIEIADLVAERLVVMLKARGISTIFTVVAESTLGELESAPTRISTIADTWIHLSFANRGGERNRTLTIVKARGLEHSNQMRELMLSSEGIDLADVYATGGTVLLGTARVAQEQQDAVDRAIEADTLARKLAGLEREAGNLRRRITEAQRNLTDIDVQRTDLLTSARSTDGVRDESLAAIHILRDGDPV